jgi:hypothetical protein
MIASESRYEAGRRYCFVDSEPHFPTRAGTLNTAFGKA